MAEDMGDKTEAPTPKRRREAREQGNIARSPDLTAAVVILGIMLMLNWYGPDLVKALKTLVGEMLSDHVLSDSSTSSLLALVIRAMRLVAGAMAPLMLGVLFIA